MNDEMPQGWEPRTRGRRPLVNHAPVLMKAQDKPGQWLAFSTYSVPEIRSLMRQLSRYEGVEVSQEQPPGRDPVLYVKWEEMV